MLKFCLGLILVILAASIHPLTLSANPGGRDFPSLHITSELHPFEQEREYWHGGTLSLMSENDEWNFHDEEILIRGRGNTTWWYAPTKRPLRLRFETPRAMFGLEPHRDWILLANAFDASLLRTHFIFYFAAHLGDTTNYVPRTQFVHLYVNGEYKGVYQLTDERDNGPGRGNVRVHEDPNISEYWLEMDMRTTDYFNINGLYYDIRMPSGSSLTDAHIDYAHGFMLDVSYAIRSRNWERINRLVCITSFVDFYIVQEWSKELDIFFSSVFMQILGQGEDRRLVLGPFWDFDNSFASNNFAPWGITIEPVGELWAQRHYWFGNLMRMQEFRNLVALRWKETSDARDAALDNLGYMIVSYQQSFERNFAAVPMDRYSIGVSRSPRVQEIGADWVMQVEYLIYFASRRASWLCEYFAYLPSSRFSDVHPLDWFYPYVMGVYDTGALTGHVGNVFSPNKLVRHGEFLHILSFIYDRLLRIDEQTGLPKAVNIGGLFENFNCYEHLTRLDMALVLYNMALLTGTQLTYESEIVFDDVGYLPPQKIRAINGLRTARIMSGRQVDIFDPRGTVTRAEAATVVVRFMALTWTR